METATLLSKVESAHSGAILEKGRFGHSGTLVLWVEAEKLPRIAKAIGGDFDWLENFSVLQMEEILVLTYFLRSTAHPESELVLRSSVVPGTADELTEIPSVRGVWRMAESFEREAHEFFGLRFTGKDFRNQFEWSGFPLRKNYVFR